MNEVAGAAILDYIVRNLSMDKVSDIFVLTSKHKKEIEQHLSKYKREITVVYSENCVSFGDALRVISDLRIIKENFLLLKGTCLMNLNLGSVFEKYESITKARKEVIMLKVFTKNSTFSELRTKANNPLLLLDQDNAILYMENLQGHKTTLKGKFW